MSFKSAVCSNSVGDFMLKGYLLANNSLFLPPAQMKQDGEGNRAYRAQQRNSKKSYI